MRPLPRQRDARGQLPVAGLRERVVATGYLVGWRVVRVLPEPVAYRGFDLVADAAWLARGRGVRQLEANLRRVRPDLDRHGLRALAREGMRSYLRYWCDVFRLPGWSTRRLVDTVRTEGDAPVRAVLAQGRGVVMALAHQGNWDHAGAWSAQRLARVTTVAERLRPEEVFEVFREFRERLGIEILPLTGGRQVFSTLVRRLRAGGFVPLLADRDLTSAGVAVQLFGETARMAAGPASLALVSGAALHPVTIRYERLGAGASARWGTVITFHREVPRPEGGTRPQQVAEMTQACADALATGIAAHPQDWHMLQQVFAADLAAGVGLEPSG